MTRFRSTSLTLALGAFFAAGLALAQAPPPDGSHEGMGQGMPPAEQPGAPPAGGQQGPGQGGMPRGQEMPRGQSPEPPGRQRHGQDAPGTMERGQPPRGQGLPQDSPPSGKH